MVEYFTSELFCLQRKHLAHEYFLTIFFYGEELLAPRPTPKLEDHPLSAVQRLLIQFIRSYPPYRRPFLHPQTEDAPCRGGRAPQTRQIIDNAFYNYIQSISESISGTQRVGRGPLGAAESLDASPSPYMHLSLAGYGIIF